MIAIVINPKDDDQIWIRFTADYQSPIGKQYKAGDQYTLSNSEKAYIQATLGIKITLPETVEDEEGDNNNVCIGGSIRGSNITMGNNNQVTQDLPNGGKVNLIISGSGVKVEQVK